MFKNGPEEQEGPLTTTCTVAVRRVDLDMIFNLRYRVLRAGRPPEAARFEGDEHPRAWHIGAFVLSDTQNILVSCATFMLTDYEYKRAWQLRGMATEPQYQKCGVGRKLLAFAEANLPICSGVRRFWCNARLPAIPFYEKAGWKTVSDEFDIPGVGPHRKMFKEFRPFN